MDKRKQYELYVKKITDAFVDMQTEKGIVEWNGGVKYSINTHTSLALVGITIKDIKKTQCRYCVKIS